MITSPQDLALVIVEADSEIPNARFWNECEQNVLYHRIDDTDSASAFQSKILQAQREGKRLVVELRIDPTPTIVGILKEISIFGAVTVPRAEGGGKVRMNVSAGSVVVVARRSFIENEVTYRNFYNLFNSAVSLSSSC